MWVSSTAPVLSCVLRRADCLAPFPFSHCFRFLCQFLAPHRLVVVEENVIAARAFATFVKERVMRVSEVLASLLLGARAERIAAV